MKLRLPLLGLATAIAVHAQAGLVVQNDVAVTDDKTPVMIDVLANDHGSDGVPMILEGVGATDCPGTATSHPDGTVEFDPDTVQATTQCQLQYEVEIGGVPYTGRVDLTIEYTDGQGGPGPPHLEVPTEPRAGCVDYSTDPPSPPSNDHDICCWHELLRAIDGQTDLNWDSIDALKTGGQAPNQRLLCRAADYYSQIVRPPGAGFGQPDSGAWFLNDLTRMAQEGWMDDGRREVGQGGHRGSNEILSPLYGTWHAAAYIVALERARSEGDAALVSKLESWLRTYWVMNALTAHPFPIRQATTQVTQSYCANPLPSYTVQSAPDHWTGLSVGTAGQRNLGSECNTSFNAPARAMTGIFHPGHALNALALDWSPREWRATGLSDDGAQKTYHLATRTVLLLEDQDFLAADGGSADLAAAQPPASRFGLTEDERSRLRTFVANPAADQELFEDILDYVDRDDDWRPFGDCPMTFVRTTEGTLSRFGTDSAADGGWLQLCNFNKTATFAVTVYNDGTAHYLSPGNNLASGSHESQRRGEQIVARASPSPAAERMIDRPGGELIYRVEWSPAGFHVTANFPDDPPPPPIQGPYGGAPHVLPGRLEAEFFDLGGFDLAWSDSPPNTAAHPFRPEEDVDVNVEQASPSRIFITDVEAGEWLEYTVDLESAGDYALSVEYRSETGAGDGRIRFEIQDIGFSRTLTLPNLGGEWEHAHRFDLAGLTAGEQIVRLTVVDAGFELDAFHLTRLGEPRGPFGGVPHAVPGTLQIEHYDEGDPGDAYGDSTPSSIPQQNPFRPDDWVDAHAIAAGTVVSWIDSGEWLEYAVEVAEAGDYEVEVRFLSNGPGQLRISVLDGGLTEATALVDVPDSAGAWQIQTAATLPLGAGPRIVRLDFEISTYSLDWLRFDDPVPPPPPEQPVAYKDVLHVPRNGGAYVIPHSVLEANDTPEGQVDVDWTYALPIIGSTVGHIAKTQDAFIFTPPPGWTTGSVFRYRIVHVEDDSLDDVASVHLDAIESLPDAVDDYFEVLPGSTVKLYHNVLLHNDHGESLIFDGVVSQSSPPVQPQGGKVIFKAPASAGQTSFTYRVRDVFGNVDPTPGTVILVITADPNHPTANDDHFFMAARELDGSPARASIPRGEFLANDTLPDAGNFTWNTSPTASCGLLTERAFGWQFTAAPGCVVATWGYELTDTVNGGSDAAAVTLDIVPAPTGFAESYEVRHGDALTVTYDQLLANDDGHGLGLVMLPEEIVPPPVQYGVLDLSVPGQLTFQPAAGFHGDAVFSYVARNDMAERNPLEMDPSWRVTTDPVPVTVTVEPPDVSASDDRVMVATGLPQLDIHLTALFQNDDPSDLVEIVDWTETAEGQLDLLSGRFRYLPHATFWTTGSDRFTYTVRRVGGSGFATTATVRLEAEPACAGGLGDDFESGGFDAWTHRLESGGALSLAPEAAMQGADGLRVDVAAGAIAVRLGERALRGASHPVLSFWFDPNSIQIGDGQIHPIAAAGDALRLWFTKIQGRYRVRLVTVTDSVEAGTAWVDLDDAPHRFYLEAVAASGIDQRNGALRLWIDGMLRGELTSLDNVGLPARLVDTYLGALWSLGDTAGAYFFDDYRSCHGPAGRDSVLVDGAEDDTLDAWDAVGVQGGGEVTVAPEAALEGDRGIAFQVDSASQWVRLRSDAVDGAGHLSASFLIDPASLTIPEGENFSLFGFTGPGGWRLDLRLGYADGGFRVRQIVGEDLSSSVGPWHALAGPGIPQRLAVEWWPASGAGADDGAARLAIDGVVVDELEGLDNDEMPVASLYLGAAGGVDAGTEGTFYVDSVQAWRGSGRRRNLLLEDFESGLASGWLKPVKVGGSVSIDAAAALRGSQGLRVEVTPGDTSDVYVRTDLAAGSRHLGASFLLDLATFATPDGSELYLFGGSQPSIGWRSHARLRFSGGAFQVRLIAALDGSRWTATAWHELAGPGTAQRLGVEWWQPSSPGGSDGGARLLIDGVVVQALLGLDNDEQTFTDLRLGAADLEDETAAGSLYFDDVQIWTLDE